MSVDIFLNIPGVPVPQARARHMSKLCYNTDGSPFVFQQTYKIQRKEFSYIQDSMKSQYDGPILDEPLEIDYLFCFVYPKRWTKNQRAIAKEGKLQHLSKPDKSNLEKFYEDCMKGIIYKDDSLIVTGRNSKIYANESKTCIWIRSFKKETIQKYIDRAVIQNENIKLPASRPLCSP